MKYRKIALSNRIRNILDLPDVKSKTYYYAGVTPFDYPIATVVATPNPADLVSFDRRTLAPRYVTFEKVNLHLKILKIPTYHRYVVYAGSYANFVPNKRIWFKEDEFITRIKLTIKFTIRFEVYVGQCSLGNVYWMTGESRKATKGW